MKITDLKIGDIVCNPRTKFPMYVVALFEDGTVYLDLEFGVREGDVFEENCKDLEFAELKPEEVITCYSERFCTIKQADEKISNALKNGTVGVGFKDKRMC